MFAVDLLKGKNVPTRSRPETVVAGAVMCAVPVIAGIAMMFGYISMGTEMAIARQTMVRYDAEITKYADGVKQKKMVEQEKQVIIDAKLEVAKCLPKYVQWSDIIRAVVENMPAPMVLNKLQVTERSAKKMTRKADDPKSFVESTVSVPVLHISLSASGGGNQDTSVQEFRDKLWSAGPLKGKVDNIRVAQETDSYELFLDFKTD